MEPTGDYPPEIQQIIKLLDQLDGHYIIHFADVVVGDRHQSGLATNLVAVNEKGEPQKPSLGMFVDFMLRIQGEADSTTEFMVSTKGKRHETPLNKNTKPS
jgi:hypothetical protein